MAERDGTILPIFRGQPPRVEQNQRNELLINAGPHSGVPFTGAVRFSLSAPSEGGEGGREGGAFLYFQTHLKPMSSCVDIQANGPFKPRPRHIIIMQRRHLG